MLLYIKESHLVAIASDSATSPGVYASAMDTVVSTAYDIINRKLFSLPKLLILPGVISRQPSLLIKIFPVSSELCSLVKVVVVETLLIVVLCLPSFIVIISSYS